MQQAGGLSGGRLHQERAAGGQGGYDPYGPSGYAPGTPRINRLGQGGYDWTQVSGPGFGGGPRDPRPQHTRTAEPMFSAAFDVVGEWSRLARPPSGLPGPLGTCPNQPAACPPGFKEPMFCNPRTHHLEQTADLREWNCAPGPGL